VKIKVDMTNAERNFAAGVNYMAKTVTRIPRKAIILGEAGVILKTCFAQTKQAPKPKVEMGARLRALRGLGLTSGSNGNNVTVNAGTARAPGSYGRMFIRKKNGDGFRRVMEAGFKPAKIVGGARDGALIHFGEKEWNQIIEARISAGDAVDKAVPEARRSAGLARQSWLLIADALGIRLENVPGGRVSGSAISEARKAVAKGGQQINNGRGFREESAAKYFVTLIDRLPYGRKIGLDGILRRTIAGRAKFMRLAVAHGFEGALADTARLFPAWQMIGKRNPKPFYTA
jgi:hypothetical protein